MDMSDGTKLTTQNLRKIWIDAFKNLNTPSSTFGNHSNITVNNGESNRTMKNLFEAELISNGSNSGGWLYFIIVLYVILTAVIVIGGLIGNSLCIRRLVRDKVLRQPSSQFFVALCICDILVLIFYVLPEWLNRGIYLLTKADAFRWTAVPGLCQIYLFFSYWMRLLSVWTLAFYSTNQYLNIRKPRSHRSRLNVKTLLGICATTLIISVFKPYLSRSVTTGIYNRSVCGTRPETQLASFIYDVIYGFLVVILPSAIIVVANCAIAIRLYSMAGPTPSSVPSTPATAINTDHTNYNSVIRRSISYFKTQTSQPRQSQDSSLAFQFSVLLILTSLSFIFLSWPRFFILLISWWHFDRLKLEKGLDDQIASSSITQKFKLMFSVLYYSHFAINLLLYTLVTHYFKKQIKRAYTLQTARKVAQDYYAN